MPAKSYKLYFVHCGECARQGVADERLDDFADPNREKAVALATEHNERLHPKETERAAMITVRAGIAWFMLGVGLGIALLLWATHVATHG